MVKLKDKLKELMKQIYTNMLKQLLKIFIPVISFCTLYEYKEIIFPCIISLNVSVNSSVESQNIRSRYITIF